MEVSRWVCFLTNLNELLFQLVDGEALPLLQDGHCGLLSVRSFVSSESVLLPLRDVIGHHADASHVSCDLTTIDCNRAAEDDNKETKQFLGVGHTRYNKTGHCLSVKLD